MLLLELSDTSDADGTNSLIKAEVLDGSLKLLGVDEENGVATDVT